MKIVVLDGYTLNPGDLSWDEIKKQGRSIEVFDRTTPDLIVERAKDASIVFTNKTVLGEKEFASLPRLKYVGVLATGYNVVDVESAKKLGITVTNIPTYGTRSVAQLTFALILELCHHVQNHSDAAKNGAWSKSIDFCFWNHPLIELDGKNIGIIGFGRIGQQTAVVAEAFGMNIIAHDKNRPDTSKFKNVKWSNLDGLLAESDIVSLHCPLFPETKGIINKTSLLEMKKSAFLINTSRGPLIVDQDLADALNNRVIAGAGIDVLSVEPPPADNPLLGAKNCIITPHIAWATKEARTRLMATAAENLKAYINGKPVNVVSN